VKEDVKKFKEDVANGYKPRELDPDDYQKLMSWVVRHKADQSDRWLAKR
jgi:hypothetical protein